MSMQTLWVSDSLDYDGRQLRAHWLLDTFGLVGDAIVGFRGGCEVADEEMADLADLDGPGIAADEMVHFVWETFTTPDLLLATHRQRLFAGQVFEWLTAACRGADLRRDGDDLFVADGKLSISIATVTPVSALIHFAVNVRASGAPVEVASLEDLGVEPTAFGEAILSRVAAEQVSIEAARAKVRSKGEWR